MTRSRKVCFFFASAGVLFLITAGAKIVSSLGNARVLEHADPVTRLTFRHLFLVVGAIEFLVPLACIFGKSTKVQAGLVAWLATTFIAYRLDLRLMGFHEPCKCLGDLTGALHISAGTADTLMKIRFFRDYLGEIHWQKHTWRRFGAPLGLGQMPFGRCECAYSRGLGESVTRGDRRGRELGFGSPSPPLAGPCEWDGASLVLDGIGWELLKCGDERHSII